MSRTVIVTDGEQRAALAVVRSLGRAGWRTIVCSTSKKSLAGGSRFASLEATVPDPLTAPTAFAETVACLASQHNAALVLPIAEPALLAVLDALPTFRETVIPIPTAAAFRGVSDKGRLLARAAAAGLAVPAQITLSTPEEIREVDPAALSYPLVVKPIRSVAEGGRRRIGLRVAHARDEGELTLRLGQLPAEGFPVLLQQRIIGPGVGIFLLLWNGDCRAVFAHRRILEKPPSGGVSVYREAIAAPADLVRCSRMLLETFGWNGVAMVEFKVDAGTGTPYLMEVNGRFWGSLQLAIDAGVDFPRLLAGAALDEPGKEPPAYRPGVRSRWSMGVVDHLLARMRHSDLSLGLAPDAPSRLKTASMILRSIARPADRDEILRVNDPAPFVRELSAWARRR